VETFSAGTLPKLAEVADETARAMRQMRRTVSAVDDNPQSLIFGNGPPVPGPGEPGFSAKEERKNDIHFQFPNRLAINSVASRQAGLAWAAGLFALALAGCSGLPDKPTRATMYDFGPGPLATQPTTRQAPLLPLALDDVSTSGGALDNMAVLYRLGYADAQQLRPYSQARWSMPPAQLVRQRVREKLGQRRAVFSAGASVALNRSQNAVLPLLLRLDLEEFSQLVHRAQ
jgi:ABC-type uncharacterized transport system auxiliary subunit